MALFDKNLPRNADRPIENSEDVVFTAGAATLPLSTSSASSFDLTLTQNSALTVTGATDGQVMNMRVEHTGGPWTLSLNGSALTLNAAAGDVEFVTCKYNGTEWECQEGVPVDVTV